jgi:hypothetical protein
LMTFFVFWALMKTENNIIQSFFGWWHQVERSEFGCEFLRIGAELGVKSEGKFRWSEFLRIGAELGVKSEGKFRWSEFFNPVECCRAAFSPLGFSDCSLLFFREFLAWRRSSL